MPEQILHLAGDARPLLDPRPGLAEQVAVFGADMEQRRRVPEFDLPAFSVRIGRKSAF